jgi:hypothetical protein
MDLDNDSEPEEPDDLDPPEFDNEADNAELETEEHEFVRPSAPFIPTADHDEPELAQSDQQDDDLEPQPSPNPASGAYTRPHIVKHNSLAGQPIAAAMSSQDSYSATVQDQGAGNIYAPFSGKLEWEIARWAKFQSHLSATAVTELLSIEGVCCCCLSDLHWHR